MTWRLGFAVAFVLACGAFFVGCAPRVFWTDIKSMNGLRYVKIDNQGVLDRVCRQVIGKPEDNRSFRGCYDSKQHVAYLGPKADACTVIHETLHADDRDAKEVHEIMKHCRGD